MWNDPIDPSVTEALNGLGMQLEAGVQLDKALRSAGPIVRTISGRRAFGLAQQRAAEGATFEQVLEPMAGLLSFPERAVLAAGWESGRIEFAIKQVITRRQVMFQTRREIRGQLILPGLVLLAAAFIAPLPAMLLGRMSFEDYLVTALTPIVLAAAVFVAIRFVQLAQTRRWATWSVDAPPPPTTLVDHLFMKLPTERLRNQSEFAIVMSNMIASGVRLLDALTITARALPNGLYRHAVLAMRKTVQAGQPLSTAMSTRLWPADWREAMQVAEVSGMEDEVLARLGADARERYLGRVRGLGRWLPRIVYAIVSAYVAVQVVRMWMGVLNGPH
jgi:type II secretory pathway component PulF